jgi:hypothetical protein
MMEIAASWLKRGLSGQILTYLVGVSGCRAMVAIRCRAFDRASSPPVTVTALAGQQHAMP